MNDEYWITPPALKPLEDLTLLEAIQIIRNLQEYIESSLQRRDTFYDNLLLMKKESDEKLDDLKRNPSGMKNETFDYENFEQNDARVMNSEGDTAKKIDPQKNTCSSVEPKGTFITEVNFNDENKHSNGSLVMITRGIQCEKVTDVVTKLEKELLQVKEDFRAYKNKLEYMICSKCQKMESNDEKCTTNEESGAENQNMNTKEVYDAKIEELTTQLKMQKQEIQDQTVLMESYREAFFELLAEDPLSEVKLKRVRVSDETTHKQEATIHKLEADLMTCLMRLRHSEKKRVSLKHDLKNTRANLIIQEKNYADCNELLIDCRKKVQILEDSKRVANDRLRKMGGLTRLTTGTQTHPITLDTGTMTENSIYDISGRSLKCERHDDFFNEFIGFHNETIKRRTPLRRSDCRHPNNVRSTYQSPINYKDLYDIMDFEDVHVNTPSTPSTLIEEKKIDDLSFICEAAYLSSMELVQKENKKENSNKDKLNFPEISTTNDRGTSLGSNRPTPTEVKCDTEVKLPSIKAGMASADAGKEANIKLSDREELVEPVPEAEKNMAKREYQSTKVGVMMKEGNEKKWRPITPNKVADTCISPQHSESNPVFSSETASCLDKVEFESLQNLRAAVKIKKGNTKREFIMSPKPGTDK